MDNSHHLGLSNLLFGILFIHPSTHPSFPLLFIIFVFYFFLPFPSSNPHLSSWRINPFLFLSCIPFVSRRLPLFFYPPSSNRQILQSLPLRRKRGSGKRGNETLKLVYKLTSQLAPLDSSFLTLLSRQTVSPSNPYFFLYQIPENQPLQTHSQLTTTTTTNQYIPTFLLFLFLSDIPSHIPLIFLKAR